MVLYCTLSAKRGKPSLDDTLNITRSSLRSSTYSPVIIEKTMNLKTSETRPENELHVDDAGEGQRIDNYLFNKLKHLPKNQIYRLLRTGQIRVNKGRKKPVYRMRRGDIVRLPPSAVPKELEEAQAFQAPNRIIKQVKKAILYEDNGLIVLNKPSGLAVHGGSGLSFGVIELLRTLYPAAPYLELVHRLDRDTSGCLMIAKKPSVLKKLHMELRGEGVEKCYLALLAGKWRRKAQVVNAPLRKNTLKSGERVVRVDAAGKASLTEFSLVEQFEHCCLVKAYPRTGRTHQIRVHAAHLALPILGDDKYGDEAMDKKFKRYGLRRLFLHASSLKFVMPGTGKMMHISAPLDPSLDDVLRALRERSDKH